MLENKKIVIIGGTTGIGLAAATRFLQLGAQIVVLGKDEASSNAAQQQLGPETPVLTGDATLENTTEAAIAICLHHFGTFDGLYHVAGGSGRRFGDGLLHELSLAGWEQTLQLNLTSAMLSNRAAVRHFLKSGHGGAIVNLSTALAYAPAPQHFATHAYAAAKAAVIGFSRSIAACYAENNIRVNVISPGLVDTPMATRALQNDSIMSYVRQRQRLDGGRAALPGDLAGLAALLLSDAGAFITGQAVGVDGGWELGC